MNIFKKEDIRKPMVKSEDAAMRTGAPYQPIQAVMTYRYGDRGSDTMRPELSRGQIYDKTNAAPYTPANTVRSAYYSVGGVKKMWCEGEK